MNLPPLSDRPRRCSSRVVRATDTGTVVQVDAEQLELNRTAFALWQLCDGHTSLGEMVMAVCDLFEIVPQQAAREVAETIDLMREAGLVT